MYRKFSRIQLAIYPAQSVVGLVVSNHPDDRSALGTLLSKGFMAYYSQRLTGMLPPVNPYLFPFRNYDLWLRVAENEKTTQAIRTPAPVFSTTNDSLIAEIKAGLWLAQLRDSAGGSAFDRYMRDYFSAWKFGHPYPEDFRKTLDTASGKNLQPVFDELNSKTSSFPPT